jgi:hypothetical protein
MSMMLFSRSWRHPLRTYHPYAGRSSTKNVVWWANETSPGKRHLAPTDQPHSGDRMMGGAKRAGCDQRRAVAGAAPRPGGGRR